MYQLIMKVKVFAMSSLNAELKKKSNTFMLHYDAVHVQCLWIFLNFCFVCM